MIELDDECVDYIVAAMQRAKEAFYVTGTGYYEQTKKFLEEELKNGNSLNTPPIGEIAECVRAAPDRWSDLQTHYYALFPGYEPNFFPNVRECFTSFARGVPIAGKPATYPAIYEYCVHQPIDQENGYHYNWTSNATLRKNAPDFDKNKQYQGPLAWVDKDQGDVFKFVMFGGPCTIHPVTQQKILNKFYGVNNPADTQECLNKRKILSNFERGDGNHCSLEVRKKPIASNNQYQLSESCVDTNGNWIK